MHCCQALCRGACRGLIAGAVGRGPFVSAAPAAGTSLQMGVLVNVGLDIPPQTGSAGMIAAAMAAWLARDFGVAIGNDRPPRNGNGY